MLRNKSNVGERGLLLANRIAQLRREATSYAAQRLGTSEQSFKQENREKGTLSKSVNVADPCLPGFHQNACEALSDVGIPWQKLPSSVKKLKRSRLVALRPDIEKSATEVQYSPLYMNHVVPLTQVYGATLISSGGFHHRARWHLCPAIYTAEA